MGKIVVFPIVLTAILTLQLQSLSAKVDSLYYKQITYENGLPGNNLRSQVQDHLGIMWISVEAMGVCRFDGQKFTQFLNDPKDSNSISSNFVNKIIEDHDGQLWFASDNGLSKFDRTKIRFNRFLHHNSDPSSVPSEICNTLFIDSQQRLLVGTGNGLAIMNQEETGFNNYLHTGKDERFENQININTIQEYPKGIFWLGTNHGLIQFSEKRGIINSWENNRLSNNEPIQNIIFTFEIDKNQKLWIGTRGGIDRFDLTRNQFDHWHFKAEDVAMYQSEGINQIILDSENKLWVSTFTKGIILINPQTEDYEFIRGESGKINSLNSNHIRYIYIDHNKNKWIGTKFDGLYKVEKKINQFDKWPKRLQILKKLSSIYIFSIFEDTENTIWIGTKTDGLYKIELQSQAVTHYSNDSKNAGSISSNRIQTILRDSKKRLWLGNMPGLDYFDEAKQKFIHCNNNLIINIIFEDKHGKIWVGTNTGLYLLNPEKFRLELFNEGENDEIKGNQSIDIYSIIEDKENNLWISTRTSGLFVIKQNDGQIIHYIKGDSTNKSINSNMVRALFEDSAGNIWIGTKGGGLNKYNPGKNEFTYYGIEEGLPSELILGIKEDFEGNIWIGTHDGISKYNPKNNTFSNFNSDAGLTSNIIEPGAVCFFSKGEMLFGGNDGFNVFYPNDIKKNEEKPRVLITAMNIFNKLVLQDISVIQDIVLEYNENYISFEFVQLDYKNPYKHQYSYILEGFDDNWNNSGSRNFISYNGLPPGKYVFKVKAANEFGNWSDNNPEIKITINPPFYKTFWFRSFFVLFVIILIATIYYQNSTRIKRRRNELEHVVEERTSSLKTAVTELSQKNLVISQQKQEIEQNQTFLEQKVKERTRELEIAKQKAEEADRLKSSFLANMSHEIRTPLNAICGFSSLLYEDDLDKSTRQEFIDLISSNSSMLLKLIEDILDISKIEAQQLTINKEKFEVNNLISDLFAIFSEEIKNQRIEGVELRCPKLNQVNQPIYIISDLFRIKQVLLNLLGNALKFCREGYIEFGYLDQGESLFFYVKDTGIGIPPSHQEMIFNRFIKIEDKKVMYRGTGLGLSISQSIVELLGGRIWVESIEGKGSTFSFKIPKGIDQA
jgi:signal transduction histidine kinase/ligand-binding sensor domain-containing protein